MLAELETVHVDVTGPEDGAPVLVVHGWGSSAELMKPVCNALSDRYRVYNIDLPGHGKTPPPSKPWGVKEYARFIHEFMGSYELNSLPLVAHSNGGRIGLFMAATPEYAHHFSKLALISPSGIKPTRRSAGYYVRSWTAKILKVPFFILPDFWKKPALHWLRNTPLWRLLGSSDYQQVTGVMRETFVQTVQFFVDDVISRISVPTLVLRGENDSAISKHQMDKLVSSVPDSALISIPGAEHFGYLTHRSAFLSPIRAFLDGPVSPSPVNSDDLSSHPSPDTVSAG